MSVTRQGYKSIKLMIIDKKSGNDKIGSRANNKSMAKSRHICGNQKKMHNKEPGVLMYLSMVGNKEN